MPRPLLLFSTNTYLKYRIQEDYRQEHYVWCSPTVAYDSVGKYARGAGTPPSSDPASIYRELAEAVRRTDEHCAKILDQKTGLLARAVDWHAAGLITDATRDDITMTVEKAPFSLWRPLLYVIPFAVVAKRVQDVPRDKRASMEPEYIIARSEAPRVRNRRALKMNLNILRQFDPATANGILAAAALANGPDPGVGERPLLLRTYEKEASQLSPKYESRLNISKDSDPEEAHALVAKVISDTLRQSILENAHTDAILKRLGNAGRLPSAAYILIQPPEFQTMFYRLGVSRNNVDDAVKHPDDHQHLMTDGMPETWQDLSLFLKFVASREQDRRHWLLVQAHRIGVDQRVGAAWRIYLNDINLTAARQPVDVLKAFVESYGVPITIGDTKALYLQKITNFPA